jgi:hypothetical protein
VAKDLFRAIGDGPGDLVPSAAVRDVPPYASWEAGLPIIRAQYEDESCASWASAYYATTAVRIFRKLKLDPKDGLRLQPVAAVRDKERRGRFVFSPSWIFNLLFDAKTWTPSAAPTLRLLRDRGGVHWYKNHESVGEPKGPVRIAVEKQANRNRLPAFGSFEPSAPKSDWRTNVKWWIANKSPVLFEFYVQGSFLEHDDDSEPIRKADGGFRDIHVIACIGYDDRPDSATTGCFRFVNSWGTHWADKGLAWVSAEVVEQMCDAGLFAWGMKFD